MGCGYLYLKIFKPVFSEFNNLSAFCADHMIMVLAEVHVLITVMSIVEPVFLSETETNHELKGVSDKIRFKIISIFLQEINQLTAGQVLFGLQKNFKNIESVFKIIYGFLFEKFFELLFFLTVNMFHINSLKNKLVFHVV